MNDRFLSLLGLSKKANKLLFGYDTVIKSVKENKAKLILLTSDISAHTENDVRKEAGTVVDILKMEYTKDDVYNATSKYSAVLALTDVGFSEKMCSLLEAKNVREEKINGTCN